MRILKYLLILFLAILIAIFVYFLVPSTDTKGEIKNIILISLDGTERKVLKQLLDDGKLPNLSQIIKEGQYRDLVLEGHKTVTRPSHATMLTGYLPSVHRVYSNFKFDPIPEGLTIFERLEDHFGEDNIVTIMTWAKGRSMRGWSKDIAVPLPQNGKSNGIEMKNLPEKKEIKNEYENTKKHLDVYNAAERHADEIGEKDLEYLEKYKDKRFFAFFHFADPDHAGHEYGYSSQYKDAIKDTDKWVGKIYSWLKDNGLSENTIVYVTTDHGWDEDFKDHNNAPRSWLITNDKEIKREGNIADIAVTILERFGVNWQSLTPPLFGKPLTEID